MVDGSWQKRGFSSKNGVVTVTSVDTGKALELRFGSSKMTDNWEELLFKKDTRKEEMKIVKRNTMKLLLGILMTTKKPNTSETSTVNSKICDKW
ncbi:hypothetical protein NPIL_325791 [Nephila pilipes]|uniref:Uncharacterized protein n=1 Tax=Nephila pilipes TaxID=299642 RepID=A0A8X6PQK6_NEPPI|nr:hypothetical protein NPIL_325791 [Nephila pilipes]